VLTSAEKGIIYGTVLGMIKKLFVKPLLFFLPMSIKLRCDDLIYHGNAPRRLTPPRRATASWILCYWRSLYCEQCWLLTRSILSCLLTFMQ